MKIPYGWIDELPNWPLTISNRPWCPFVRLTIFYGFARSHKEVSPSHAKRLAWLNLKIMRLSTGSHRCPPHHGVPPLSTTMIRAKHAIRLPAAPHPRRPPWHLWNSHLENKSHMFFLRRKILTLCIDWRFSSGEVRTVYSEGRLTGWQALFINAATKQFAEQYPEWFMGVVLPVYLGK